MVFEPTFQQISDDAGDLPDLEGAQPEADRTESGGGLDQDAPDDDADQDGVAEGEAEATIVSGDVPANDLPPLGA